MSNHVAQAAYTNVAGDKNTAYEQDLSKCKGMVFHRDAVASLTLAEPFSADDRPQSSRSVPSWICWLPASTGMNWPAAFWCAATINIA